MTNPEKPSRLCRAEDMGISRNGIPDYKKRNKLSPAERAKRAKIALQKYSKQNREKMRLRNCQWRRENPEKSKSSCRRWREKNKRKIKHRLSNCMGPGLYKALKGKKEGMGTWEILGYSCEDLMSHLERHFQPGMSWDNYGEWEIHHTIPRSLFHYENFRDVEFKMCWNLENLQPLWKKEHRKHHRELRIA